MGDQNVTAFEPAVARPWLTWAVIYASSAVFGQALTNVFDATMGRGNSAGNSMANFGLLGAVAVTALFARGRFRGTAGRAVRLLTAPAIVVLLGGVCLCVIANQHGPTLLLGAALGIVLRCADRPR